VVENYTVTRAGYLLYDSTMQNSVLIYSYGEPSYPPDSHFINAEIKVQIN
jgi:hypothetical protein